MENPLKALREEYGLTRAEMAAVMDTSPQAYCFYERGDAFPSEKKLSLVADFFGLERGELFKKMKDYRKHVTEQRRKEALQKISKKRRKR